MKSINGSLSVVMALTISVVLSFCLVLIESARENTMLLKADVLFELGMQCMAAEYHRTLWEEFDLMYVDTSFETENPDYQLFKQHLEEYIDRNLSFDNKGWLALEAADIKIQEVELATDEDGMVYLEQAIEAAEETIGIGYLEQIEYWLKLMQSNSYMESVLFQEKSRVTEQIEDVNGTWVEIEEAVWGTDKQGQPILLKEAEYQMVDIDNPLDRIYGAGLLVRQVLGSDENLFGPKMNTELFISNRTVAVGNMGQKKEAEEDYDGAKALWNKILFCKYIFDHFASFTDGYAENKMDGRLRCPVEYIIGGEESDMANLEKVMGQLLIVREIDNYLFLLQDEVRMAEAELIGASIATAAAVPWMGSVVKHALILYWAYEDSIVDLKQLYQGNRISLCKTLQGKHAEFLQLGYEDYLLLLLLLQHQERIVWNSMDMIEMYIRQSQETFRLDGCINRAVLGGAFVDRYEKQYFVTGELHYD